MSANHRKFLLAFLLVVIASGLVGCGTQIPSGYRGVFYSKFGNGTEMGKIYSEGFNWHMPWNTMFVYKIQLEEGKEKLDVLSADGATIGLDVTVWYRPDPAKLDSLQITLGKNFFNVAVAPALRGVARSVVGKFKPEEIYSTKRDTINTEILTEMQNLLSKKYIICENVIIRDIILPAKISDAINAKLAADQDAQKMQFVLLKEKQEAERKRIEAQGIADFQKIVASGVTKSLLTWKGIEATEKLAESPNSKIVVIGNSKDGLPIILGGSEQ